MPKPILMRANFSMTPETARKVRMSGRQLNREMADILSGGRATGSLSGGLSAAKSLLQKALGLISEKMGVLLGSMGKLIKYIAGIMAVSFAFRSQLKAFLQIFSPIKKWLGWEEAEEANKKKSMNKKTSSDPTVKKVIDNSRRGDYGFELTVNLDGLHYDDRLNNKYYDQLKNLLALLGGAYYKTDDGKLKYKNIKNVIAEFVPDNTKCGSKLWIFTKDGDIIAESCSEQKGDNNFNLFLEKFYSSNYIPDISKLENKVFDRIKIIVRGEETQSTITESKTYYVTDLFNEDENRRTKALTCTIGQTLLDEMLLTVAITNLPENDKYFTYTHLQTKWNIGQNMQRQLDKIKEIKSSKLQAIYKEDIKHFAEKVKWVARITIKN